MLKGRYKLYRQYKRDTDKQYVEEERIRAIDRVYYPITDSTMCEECKKEKATQRHHYTTPIEQGKFNFVCRACHNKTDNTNGKKQKGIKRGQQLQYINGYSKTTDNKEVYGKEPKGIKPHISLKG